MTNPNMICNGKTYDQYARMIIRFHNEDIEGAKRECFNAAIANSMSNPGLSNQFWVECYEFISKWQE